MRALKAVVVIMGVMIIVMTLVLIVKIIKRNAGDGVKPMTSISAPVLPATLALTLPSAAHIASMAAIDGHLALDVVSPTQESILIVDTATGKVLTTINVSHSADPQ